MIGLLSEQKSEKMLIETVWRKSQGNPFFAEQLILFLNEDTPEAFKISGESFSPSEIIVPDSVSALIIARMDRLTTELKAIIRAASVLGKQFNIKILSLMLQQNSLTTLLQSGEEQLIWQSITELLYIFKHALIRDTVDDMQLKSQLRKLHALAAETIETLIGDSIDSGASAQQYRIIAYHYAQALDTEKAADYSKQAIFLSRKLGLKSELCEFSIHVLQRQLHDFEEKKQI